MAIDIGAAAREAATVRAGAHELARVAAALGAAFEADPAASWVIPDDARRRELLERAFLVSLRKTWFAQDECWTTGAIAGAAVWELPGQWKLGAIGQLRILPAIARAYGRWLPRLSRAVSAMERDHPQAPHFYLPFVGVVPGWQGRGLGAALLGPVLDRCDRERTAAYLEASTPRNLALYERLGFAVTSEFRLGKGSPPLWRMWREPSR
ncbi:MAG TPA: GNAT family N-acetyltransferase [Solirubrobacteraceae bacterium]|nr:GNAT family N-acetyltransferase [Solirubrobacteraceae bacterium]